MMFIKETGVRRKQLIILHHHTFLQNLSRVLLHSSTQDLCVRISNLFWSSCGRLSQRSFRTDEISLGSHFQKHSGSRLIIIQCIHTVRTPFSMLSLSELLNNLCGLSAHCFSLLFLKLIKTFSGFLSCLTSCIWCRCWSGGCSWLAGGLASS